MSVQRIERGRTLPPLSPGEAGALAALYSWFKAHPAAALADFADAWRRARRLTHLERHS